MQILLDIVRHILLTLLFHKMCVALSDIWIALFMIRFFLLFNNIWKNKIEGNDSEYKVWETVKHFVVSLVVKYFQSHLVLLLNFSGPS